MTLPSKKPGARAVLASDTSRKAEQVQIELWRSMSPQNKARMVTEISLAVQEISLAGIRLRHPGATEQECLFRLAVLKIGRELAHRVYPKDALLYGD